MTLYKNIPTNIISGFLGAGKTTAIQSLLKQKPESEIWAVIVNEFGQIGIDGALLKNDSVEIKEIPGGCLCCVGSQSLNVGLNQIIRAVKPQRILIEPTGLGHPAKLVESLTGEYYKSVLDLKAIINLLDARQLKDERYISNKTFIDQSNLADILIASKLDTYTEDDKNLFFDYAKSFNPAKIKVAMIDHGCLRLEWLDLPRSGIRAAEFPELHSHAHTHSLTASGEVCEVTDIQHQDWFMVEAHANGFYSLGWKIENIFIFNQDKLLQFIQGLFEDIPIERAKGVLQTNKGWISINFTVNDRQILNVENGSFSVFEIIASNTFESERLDNELKGCCVAD